MAKPNGKPTTTNAALAEPWALPSVEVHLDKRRRVSYPITAIFRYQDASRIDVLSPPEKQLSEDQFLEWLLGDTPRKRAENLIALLWAGLTVEDPSLTRDAVGNLVGIGNMRPLLAACISALTMSLPAAEARPFVAAAEKQAAEEEKLPA